MKHFSIAFISMIVAACASEPKRTVAEPEWYSRMHRLSVTHLELTPLIAAPRSFAEPRNQSRLDSGLKEMSEIAQELVRDPRSPNSDPVIAFSAKNFADHSAQAYSAFKNADHSWSRLAFRRASDACFTCHSRADRGAKDYPLAWQPQLTGLSRAQKIDFALANRQYSMAMTEAQKMAASEQPIADPLEWRLALEKVMTLIVRVEKSPRFAEILTETALTNKNIPFYIRSDLMSWRSDIQAWKKQREKMTERGKLKLAQDLLERNRGIKYRRTGGSLIATLRASALLHELLENSKFPLYSDVLEYSGAAAEGLGDYDLGQYYYEACIKEVPHTPMAERCFVKLYNSLRETNPFLSEQTVLQTHLALLQELASPHSLDKAKTRRDRPDEPPGR